MRHSRTRARVISDYVHQSCQDGYRFVKAVLRTFYSVRYSRTRIRVVSDYVGKSCHGYRFETGVRYPRSRV